MKEAMKSHGKLLAVFALTALGAAFSFSEVFFEALEFTGDNYVYLELAQNISDGKGYVTCEGETCEPSNWFPPAYSAFIAFMSAIGADSPAALKWLNLILLLGGWGLMGLALHRKGLSHATFLVAGILLATNWALLGWANRVMSEMLFWSFSALAFIAFDRLRKHFRWKSLPFLVLILALAAAYLTRGVGIALLGGVVLGLALKRQWKLGALVILGFGLLIAPWSIRNSVHGLKGRYLKTIVTDNPWDADSGELTTTEAWLKKLKKNTYDTTVRGFIEVCAPGIPLPKEPSPRMWIFGSLFVLLCGWGMAQWKGLNWVVVGYVAASVAIFLLWHSGNGARYVWPLAPLLTLGLVTGVADLGRRVLSRIGASSAWVPFLLLGLLFWSKSSYDSAQTRQKTPFTVGQLQYLALSDTLNELAAPDDFVVLRKPEITRNLADVKCVRFPFTSDSLAMMEFLVKTNPRYILIDNGTGMSQSAKFLVPFLNRHRQLWSMEVTKSENNITSYLLNYSSEEGEQLLNAWRASYEKSETPPNNSGG